MVYNSVPPVVLLVMLTTIEGVAGKRHLTANRSPATRLVIGIATALVRAAPVKVTTAVESLTKAALAANVVSPVEFDAVWRAPWMIVPPGTPIAVLAADWVEACMNV